MRNIITSLTPLLIVFASYSQDLPKIGSEKGIKEKFILIRKGLPDIKKNLTKRDETFVDEYNVKFEMGNGIVLFEESDEYQSLTISFSGAPYFSGTITDFQNYYKELVAIVSTVFSGTHTAETENSETIWRTSFYEKGKTHSSSKTSIQMEISWLLKSPHISIEIVSNK